MRRLRRIIFNTLSILSLLLCVAMAGLWVRSYWIADAFSLVHSGGIDRPGDHGDLIAEFNMVWANGRVRYERYDTECFGGGDGGNVALPGPLWTLTHTSNTPHYAEIVEHSVWTTRQPTKWGAFVAGEEDYRGIHTISLMKYVAAPMWAVFMPLLLSSSLCAPNPSPTATAPWPLPPLRLRPPRHPRPMSGMRIGVREVARIVTRLSRCLNSGEPSCRAGNIIGPYSPSQTPSRPVKSVDSGILTFERTTRQAMIAALKFVFCFGAWACGSAVC